MQAMILAAGMGTRLQPLTHTLPKALVPVLKKPALEWQIRRLQKIGVDSLAVNVHCHARQIVEFVQQYRAFPVITLFAESQILGTGGGLLNTRDYWRNQSFFFTQRGRFFLCRSLASLPSTPSSTKSCNASHPGPGKPNKISGG